MTADHDTIFLIIFSPARSWEIEADKSESESEVPKIWNKFNKRLSNSLPSWMKSAHKKVYNTLPAGLLVGVFVFVACYQAVVKLEEALKSVSHVSVPFVISFIGWLLPFVKPKKRKNCRADFPKFSWGC